MVDMTKRIVAFCCNPNEFVMPLENSKQVFLKFPITPALIGLAIVKNGEDNIAATMDVGINAMGFYSKDTGKLYFRDDILYTAAFWDDKKDVPCASIKYEPLPLKKMKRDLADAVTKELEKRVPKPEIDVLKDDISIAKADYFNCRDRGANIHPADICNMMQEIKLTANKEVEQYLAQPEKWLDTAAARLLEQRPQLYMLYEKRLKIHTIIQALKDTPHQWKRARRLAEVVTDKTTVTVTTVDGETFRVKTSGLELYHCGVYDDSCILPKYRTALLESHHTEFYRFFIEEIKKVEYNGKVIFE